MNVDGDIKKLFSFVFFKKKKNRIWGILTIANSPRWTSTSFTEGEIWPVDVFGAKYILNEPELKFCWTSTPLYTGLRPHLHLSLSLCLSICIPTRFQTFVVYYCEIWLDKYSSLHLFFFNRSFLHLGAGLSVGLSGLAAGFAIGIVGDAGVRGTAQQPRLFVGMILILIFAEVLGLYGLIVALILSTK